VRLSLLLFSTKQRIFAHYCLNSLRSFQNKLDFADFAVGLLLVHYSINFKVNGVSLLSTPICNTDMSLVVSRRVISSWQDQGTLQKSACSKVCLFSRTLQKAFQDAFGTW